MTMMKTHFELIAAKAKIMAEQGNPWPDDVVAAVVDIEKSCAEIKKEAYKNRSGSR